jgi:predicted RNase H-like HicB family nuclease
MGKLFDDPEQMSLEWFDYHPPFEIGLPIEIVAFIAKHIPPGRPEVRHPTARAVEILKSSADIAVIAWKGKLDGRPTANKKSNVPSTTPLHQHVCRFWQMPPGRGNKLRLAIRHRQIMRMRSELPNEADRGVMVLEANRELSEKEQEATRREDLVVAWDAPTSWWFPVCVIAWSRSLGKLSVMKFVITLDRDEDGIWIAECPAIPGCVSQGLTRDEALTNIREAIALCLEVRAERGLPLTIETRQVEVRV